MENKRGKRERERKRMRDREKDLSKGRVIMISWIQMIDLP